MGRRLVHDWRLRQRRPPRQPETRPREAPRVRRYDRAVARRRFDNHKAGIKEAWVVKRYGLRLMPELFEHLNPMPFEAAALMEQALAHRAARSLFHQPPMTPCPLAGGDGPAGTRSRTAPHAHLQAACRRPRMAAVPPGAASCGVGTMPARPSSASAATAAGFTR